MPEIRAVSFGPNPACEMSESIDLHTHSTASDGTYTPSDLIHYAKTKGLRAVALTDHDCIDGIDEAVHVGWEIGLEVIPGLEISADFSDGSMHLLGYFVDRSNPAFLTRLSALQQARKERNPKIVAKLRDQGMDLSYEEVEAVSGGGQVGRPHIARLLMEKGYVPTMADAFDRYLKKGAPAYVPRARFSPEESIELIHAAQGLAVLAHPSTLKVSPDRLDRVMERLCAGGLDGLEVYYSTYSDEESRTYAELAARWELIPTGGSDFHGAHKPHIDLGIGRGDLRIPYTVLERLRDRRRTVNTEPDGSLPDA